MLNLSVSGALIRDVIADQIPQLDGQRPDLVTCGAGANDILYSAPGKLFSDLRALLAAVPRGHGHARPAAAFRLLGDRRPDERPLHHPHQPGHPRGRDRAGPAGGRGQQALRPAVGRQVLRRQLPPEPGRLPRLVQGPGRGPHPGPRPRQPPPSSAPPSQPCSLTGHSRRPPAPRRSSAGSPRSTSTRSTRRPGRSASSGSAGRSAGTWSSSASRSPAGSSAPG